MRYRIYDIATNLLHHNEYVSLKEFAKDLAEHGITLTGRKNDNGKTVGIIFTIDGMSFAGGKIDKSLSLVNVMQLIDRYRDLYPGRAMFQEAKDIDSYWGYPYIAQPNSTNFTETNSQLSPSPLSSVASNEDSTATTSGDSGIASHIIDAAVELVLQPDISPTPSVGGGSYNKHDDDDDEKKRKSKNKNQPTQRTGRRR